MPFYIKVEFDTEEERDRARDLVEQIKGVDPFRIKVYKHGDTSRFFSNAAITYGEFISIIKKNNIDSGVEYKRFRERSGIIGLPKNPGASFKRFGFGWKKYRRKIKKKIESGSIKLPDANKVIRKLESPEEYIDFYGIEVDHSEMEMMDEVERRMYLKRIVQRHKIRNNKN